MPENIAKALGWLENSQAKIVNDLDRLVGIKSISTDGEHQQELDHSASAVCELMKEAGLNDVRILKSGDSNPFAYGEWLGAPGQPTLFLYSHHDVQPVNYESHWLSDPWRLVSREGRLFARGSADDKGAAVAHIASIAAWLKTSGKLPVNVKVLVEGEEEIGSRNLMKFFNENRARVQADAVVVCDTENIQVGKPSITYSLRGVVTLLVQVKSAKIPAHSGMAGGALADSAIALSAILSRLYWDNQKLPIQGFYNSVRPLGAEEKKTYQTLGGGENELREILGVPKNVRSACWNGLNYYEQTWRQPAITVIALEASSIKGASNQVLPTASALVSCRIVPDQNPREVEKALIEYLKASPPWGVEVSVEPHGNSVDWWMTDPQGPAFEAAIASLRKGFNTEPVGIGCGGTIGFVRPLVELLGGVPALLFGIEDPHSNAHAPNESLHQGDWFRLMKSLIYFYSEAAGKVSVKV